MNEVPIEDRVPGRSTKALEALDILTKKSPSEIDSKAGMELVRNGLACYDKGKKMFALSEALKISDSYHEILLCMNEMLIKRNELKVAQQLKEKRR